MVMRNINCVSLRGGRLRRPTKQSHEIAWAKRRPRNDTSLNVFVLVALILQGSFIFAQDQVKEKEDQEFGISTDFGDVLIDNLGIGRTYNLREIAGTPLKVKNKSSNTINLFIDVNIPTEKMITEKRKNMGVQPIPSLAWVQVGQSEFILPPGETAFTDVLITIPDDTSLHGKKFQASIHSRTTGKNFIQLGVWSHVMFSIIQNPEDQAKMEKNQQRGIRKTADFTLLPDKIYVTNVPRGRPVDVRKEFKKTMKITNIGENPVELSVKVIPIAYSPLSLQTGFEEGSSSWLRAEKELFQLDVDSVVDPGWILSIPNDPKLSGRKFMFVVKVEPSDKEVIGFTFYGQFYVEVEQ